MNFLQRFGIACAVALAEFAVCPSAAAAAAEPLPSQVAQRACAAIAGRVGAASGPPVFLVSYTSEGATSQPALKTAAFTYDNALAVIALIACGRVPQAVRVGEALRKAALGGPRLLNAYRAGVVEGQPLPNGWWDAKANQWAEDPYQMGTATGNVAWAGLALLALDRATGDRRWRDAAERLALWIVDNAWDASGTPGFTGGVEGFDPHPQKLRWKSTEHNVDAAALLAWLARGSSSNRWSQPAREAMHFVATQWDATTGRFLVGTLPDGRENTGTSAIDVQMWAQLLPGARPDWRRALAYAQAHFAVDGGFDFNTDRDGVWLEGTAQAALVYGTLGNTARADALFRTIDAEFSPGGYVYATREARITTGLALSPQSTTADFYYYHWPHLAPTAWAVLAAKAWNPFVPHGAAHDPGKSDLSPRAPQRAVSHEANFPR
ncbi:MAG TPA: hypothetical protein VFQ95_02995 [Rhodanobacteraceae bacterium]|nr:hypothetical protein [Rhodanobacteraceae bacterium]